MKRPLEMAHDFLAEVVTKEDIVVDATMGNGHDTLFLAKLAKQVLCLLIFQEQALGKDQGAFEPSWNDKCPVNSCKVMRHWTSL